MYTFAVAPSYWFGVLALGACGLAFITCIPAINASIQLGVGDRMRGRALAFAQDRDLRSQVKRDLLERVGTLFERRDAALALGECLLRIAETAR